MKRISYTLSFKEKMARSYAIWWDVMNTAMVVFVISMAFITFAIILLAGRMDLLPFEETVWHQFIETVSPSKQSEIGIGVLSVAISGSSAAALYLIRIGTTRWAMNRRIGHIHAYFAEAIFWRCTNSECSHDSLSVVMSSFVTSSLSIFEQISETHPKSQIFFEQARMKSHIFLGDKGADNIEAIEIATDLFCAALLCQKTIELPKGASPLYLGIQRKLQS